MCTIRHFAVLPQKIDGISEAKHRVLNHSENRLLALTEVGNGHHVWDAEEILDAIHHGTGGWASHICAENRHEGLKGIKKSK